MDGRCAKIMVAVASSAMLVGCLDADTARQDVEALLPKSSLASVFCDVNIRSVEPPSRYSGLMRRAGEITPPLLFEGATEIPDLIPSFDGGWRLGYAETVNQQMFRISDAIEETEEQTGASGPWWAKVEVTGYRIRGRVDCGYDDVRKDALLVTKVETIEFIPNP